MQPIDPRFWNLPSADLQAQLGVAASGLSQREARRRLLAFGPNTLRVQAERRLILQYLDHFKNPLVMILLAASAVSALTGELTGFVIIWTIVLMSVTLDFVQEYRAGRAVERLQQTVALHASVLRDDLRQDLPMEQLVPGDVVLLSAG
ncbi:MAG: cation-transporting P-type ATPase, partial [Sterolibacterium sp.]